MKLIGPDKYDLTCDAADYCVVTKDGKGALSDRAKSRCEKLYVFASGGTPIYVGITKQNVRARLRLGWKADGSTGYHGYALRHYVRSFNMFVWYHPDSDTESARGDLETIEAEVVYLIRKRGQWPKFQTEIHFHHSRKFHRDVAKSILADLAKTARRK